jgi:hypothetical protein
MILYEHIDEIPSNQIEYGENILHEYGESGCADQRVVVVPFRTVNKGQRIEHVAKVGYVQQISDRADAGEKIPPYWRVIVS